MRIRSAYCLYVATMRDTKKDVAHRWLTRFGPPGPVPDEAVALLRRRLAIRRGVARTMVAPVALAIVSFGLVSYTTVTSSAVTQHDSLAAFTALVFALLCVSMSLGEETIRLRERALVRSLPRRVARTQPVPTFTGALPRRMTVSVLIVLALVAHLARADTGRPQVRSAVVATLLVGCAATLVGTIRLANRRAVAVDPVSLQIDERLRRLDAARVASMLPVLSASTIVLLPPHDLGGLLGLQIIASFLALLALSDWSMAQWWTQQPWTGAP